MSKPLVYMVAGEPSGDALGAPLMAALTGAAGGDVAYAGIGGPLMEKEGLKSLFPMPELTVMGLAEVIPQIPGLLRRVNQTADDIVAKSPVAVVTIDSPDFSFRVAKRVKARAPEIPLIHYVAPTVWAWRPGRARKIAAFLDHILCLFRFEPPYFEREGLAASFVGHPVLSGRIPNGDGPDFRKRHNIPAAQPVLTVLPGSRKGEVGRLLPVLRECVMALARDVPSLHVAVPTVENVLPEVRAETNAWPVPVMLISSEHEKADAFAASGAAIAASGTVTLELAAARVPAVVIYKVNPVSAFLGRLLIKFEWVSLPNILMKKEIYPEFLQEDCMPAKIVPAVKARLLGTNKGETAEDLREVLKQLGPSGPAPAEAAAAAVRNVIGVIGEPA